MGSYKARTVGLTVSNLKQLFPVLAPTAAAIQTSIPQPIKTGNQQLTVSAALNLWLSEKKCAYQNDAGS